MASSAASKIEPPTTIESTISDQATLRNLLAHMISSSTDLEARVWLDGVYTDLQDSQVRGKWIMDREVYFKVEGRVERGDSSKR